MQIATRIRRKGRAAARSLPFWVKTPLYRVTPGGFGYYRHLHRFGDAGYVHERDKHEVRRKHHGTEGLREADTTGLVRRDYESYDEYLTHQALKLDEMLKSGSAFSNATVFADRLRYFRRFRHLVHLLPRDARILCLGARQGTEVEVLRDLGFGMAEGIDLNPGPDNPFVRRGDFQRLDERDSTIDLVYSNSLDHALDLDDFFREHARVVRPGGFALYDIHDAYQLGQATPFEATLWRRTEDVLVRSLGYFERVRRLESEAGWTWVLLEHPLPSGPPKA